MLSIWDCLSVKSMENQLLSLALIFPKSLIFVSSFLLPSVDSSTPPGIKNREPRSYWDSSLLSCDQPTQLLVYFKSTFLSADGICSAGSTGLGMMPREQRAAPKALMPLFPWTREVHRTNITKCKDLASALGCSRLSDKHHMAVPVPVG